MVRCYKYMYYCVAHIAIFGRPRGAPRHGKPALRRRAALAADDLHSLWLALREACGVRNGSVAAARRDAATGLREADRRHSRSGRRRTCGTAVDHTDRRRPPCTCEQALAPGAHAPRPALDQQG